MPSLGLKGGGGVSGLDIWGYMSGYMDFYGWILQDHDDKSGYFRMIMDIMPTIELLETQSGTLPACSGVQLYRDLLLHVLHINGISHFFFWRPQVRPLPAPASSGVCSGPVAALAPAPVLAAPAQDIGCVSWILCWHQYTNKKLSSTSPIQLLSWCSGPTCWSVCARYWVQFRNYAIYLYLEGPWIWKNMQGYEGILAGWLERGSEVGAVHGKLALDIHHWYESWIKWDITGYNFDNIVGFLERYIEWISVKNILNFIGWISKNRCIMDNNGYFRIKIG